MKKVIDLEKIDIDDAIKEILLSYSRDLQEDMNELTKSVAKEGKTKLKASSPKKTGKYAKGWTTSSSTKKNGNGLKATKVTLYNKNKPGLTHLLEYGHANRNGGYVPPKPHIDKVAKELEEKFLKKAEEIIKRH